MDQSQSRYEIEKLLLLYAERIDLGDFEALADLFEHAVITTPGAKRGPGGRDAALEIYETATRRYEDGTPKTKHVTTNIIIELAADAAHAEARSYFTVFQALADFPLQPIIAGRYRDQFACVEGCWRFEERMIIPELFGDLSRHLMIEVPSTN